MQIVSLEFLWEISVENPFAKYFVFSWNNRWFNTWFHCSTNCVYNSINLWQERIQNTSLVQVSIHFCPLQCLTVKLEHWDNLTIRGINPWFSLLRIFQLFFGAQILVLVCSFHKKSSSNNDVFLINHAKSELCNFKGHPHLNLLPLIGWNVVFFNSVNCIVILKTSKYVNILFLVRANTKVCSFSYHWAYLKPLRSLICVLYLKWKMFTWFKRVWIVHFIILMIKASNDE